MTRTESAVPNTARFMREVLRGSEYTFSTAIADIVDNSITAGAKNIQVWIDYLAYEVLILDDGSGMSNDVHRESMKIAAETREYTKEDLGKYGTGMKAASLSQAARLVVATRPKGRKEISVRCLDMDHINKTNDWGKLTLLLEKEDLPKRAKEHLESGNGTAVVWQKIDRIFADEGLTPTMATQELKNQTLASERHLAMVFHRFLAGETTDMRKVSLFINGNAIQPWDPFARTETTIEVASESLKINKSAVRLTGYVLPTEKEFSSKAAFVSAAGPKRWNESQGFYVYRNDRLIRWGGWLRMRANDEHNKFARIALDFNSDLDKVFQVNVAKSSVTLPEGVKALFKTTVEEVCSRANKRYRAKLIPKSVSKLPSPISDPNTGITRRLTGQALASLLAKVAADAQLNDELEKLKTALRQENERITNEIGW